MDQLTLSQLQHQIDTLTRMKQQLRADERGLRERQALLLSQPQVNKTDLRSALGQYLPPHLMPGNVGGFNCVTWPFWFSVNFEFGDDPVIQGGITRQIQTFQVTQEAALLLIGVSRQADSYNTAGHLGPWNITIRDNQSSRQFNDGPIPIQMISAKGGLPTKLPICMLFMPNAIVSCEMGNWLPQGVSMPSTGSGSHQFTFFGYRIRIEDTEKVLSSAFAPYAG